MIVLPKQKTYLREAIKRINTTEGSVRSGKTRGTMLRWIDFIGRYPIKHTDFMMFGKSQGSLRRNIIRDMQRLLGKQMKYKIGSNEIDLWGHKIYCFGAYDAGSEDTIRGATFGGSYGDEITLCPEAFFIMMLSRLSLPGAQFHGSTNPDNPFHWFKVNFLDRAKELDLYNLHFVLEDNTTLDPAYVEALKKEYIGLWYRRFILGLWCAAEGAIHDFFEKELHTRPPNLLPVPKDNALAVDYGTGNPTAAGIFGIDRSLKTKAWLRKEYFYDSVKAQRQKTDEEYSVDMCDFIRDEKVSRAIVDPSAASFKVSLRRAFEKEHWSIPIIDADNDVINGIRKHSTMLKNGEYIIGDNCPRTIQDYFGYCWDKKAQVKGIDAPLKTNGCDHTKDYERYFLQTTFGHTEIQVF